jgi:hypothetical protein
VLSQVIKRVIMSVWRKFLGDEVKVSAGGNATAFKRLGFVLHVGQLGRWLAVGGDGFAQDILSVGRNREGSRLAVLLADVPIKQALEEYLDTLLTASQVGLDKETRTTDRIMEGQGRWTAWI